MAGRAFGSERDSAKTNERETVGKNNERQKKGKFDSNNPKKINFSVTTEKENNNHLNREM